MAQGLRRSAVMVAVVGAAAFCSASLTGASAAAAGTHGTAGARAAASGPADGVIWNITNQRLRTIPPKVCTPTGALVIAGVGITNPQGAIALSVNDFYCPPEGNFSYGLQEPIILTATAGGSQPVYMTTETVWGDRDNNELTLRFFSWGIGGRPVPNTVFRWHLTIATSFSPG
jgi:hypothetical protein